MIASAQCIMGNTGSLRRGSAVLQDASDLARFERVRSGDKGQGESTVLKWPQTFYRNLVPSVPLKAERIRPKIPEKVLCNRGTCMTLTKIVLYKQKQLYGISVRLIQILFSV